MTVDIQEALTSARHKGGGMDMRKTGLALMLLALSLAVSACAPLVVGGAVAVVADEAVEQEQGGDGLF